MGVGRQVGGGGRGWDSESLVLTSISPKDEIHVWTKLDVEPLVAHEIDQRYFFQNAYVSFPLITENRRYGRKIIAAP